MRGREGTSGERAGAPASPGAFGHPGRVTPATGHAMVVAGIASSSDRRRDRVRVRQAGRVAQRSLSRCEGRSTARRGRTAGRPSRREASRSLPSPPESVSALRLRLGRGDVVEELEAREISDETCRRSALAPASARFERRRPRQSECLDGEDRIRSPLARRPGSVGTDAPRPVAPGRLRLCRRGAPPPPRAVGLRRRG